MARVSQERRTAQLQRDARDQLIQRVLQPIVTQEYQPHTLRTNLKPELYEIMLESYKQTLKCNILMNNCF